jgi:acid phosphatase
MKINLIKRYIWILPFLLLFSGCEPDVPINLTIVKTGIEKYYESGAYQEDLNEIVDRAIKYFALVPSGNNATVIFDVDDTVLSNYADEKSISFGYIPKLNHEWVLEADAPVIQETKRLYDYLIGRQFKIVFLTGRKNNQYDATIKNLKLQGFAKFEKLIVRQDHELKMTAQEYKSSRRKQLTEEGYRIVGNVGDQESDLKGGYSGYQVKLPNCRYFLP